MRIGIVFGLVFLMGLPACAAGERLRVAAFNVQDLKTDEVLAIRSERLGRLADVLVAIDADVVLLSEVDGARAGRSGAARRFDEAYLEERGLRYKVVEIESNTGVHSGHDLDNNGVNDPGSSGRQYGGDSFGYGEYPGQYSMALLVREGLEVVEDEVRTFRMFKWKDMPGALIPDGLDGRPEWYSAAEVEGFRLSSKNHADIPVRLTNGAVVHFLCSHPTPPAFDGEEDRNGRRNHDEIRFWGAYIDGAEWIVDDAGRRGGLEDGARFVVLGDLNADPEGGSSYGDPMGEHLLGHSRVQGARRAVSVCEVEGLDDWDTARFRLRVDYVLPSVGMRLVDQGVWRGRADSPGWDAQRGEAMTDFPSDHYPVWAELAVPRGDWGE